MSTDIKRLTPEPRAVIPTLWAQHSSTAKLLALVGATLVLVLAYLPNLVELERNWRYEPNYSHGYLVIPIALYILKMRLTDKKSKATTENFRAPWLGWAFLIPVLLLRNIAYEKNWQSIETATLLPALLCLAWSFGSWPLVRKIWPAVAFLVFMLPLPPSVNDLLAMPLQTIAATGSRILLQLSGLWVVQDGNVLLVRTHKGDMTPLDVAEACSGLRMLMTMAATIAAAVIVFELPTWKRVVLLISVIPIALLSNMIRIVVTGWCYHFFTQVGIRERATTGPASR